MGLADRYLPRRAVVDLDAAADAELVAPVAGKRLIVVSLLVVNVAGTEQAVTFKSWDGTDDEGDLTGLTVVTGPLALPEAAGGVLDFAEADFGIFETQRGEGLAVELSAATAVGGVLTYVTAG